MTATASLGRYGARLSIAAGSDSGVDEELFHCASGGDVAHGASQAGIRRLSLHAVNGLVCEERASHDRVRAWARRRG